MTTVELLQTVRAIEALDQLAKQLRRAAEDLAKEKDVGRHWYDAKLRRQGRVKAYREIAAKLEAVKRDL